MTKDIRRRRLACLFEGDLVRISKGHYRQYPIDDFIVVKVAGPLAPGAVDDLGFRYDRIDRPDIVYSWYNSYWPFEFVDQDAEASRLLVYGLLLSLQPSDCEELIVPPKELPAMPDWLKEIADKYSSTRAVMYHIMDMNVNVWDRRTKSKKTFGEIDFSRAAELAANLAPILDRYFREKEAEKFLLKQEYRRGLHNDTHGKFKNSLSD